MPPCRQQGSLQSDVMSVVDVVLLVEEVVAPEVEVGDIVVVVVPPVVVVVPPPHFPPETHAGSFWK